MVELMRFTKTKVESQIVGKAKAKNYLRREVKLEGQINAKAEAVELECFAKTKVESSIVGKAIAKNYSRGEVELEGQISAKVEAKTESQIVNKAEVKNRPIREEIYSKLTSVSNNRQLNPLNFEGK